MTLEEGGGVSQVRMQEMENLCGLSIPGVNYVLQLDNYLLFNIAVSLLTIFI